MGPPASARSRATLERATALNALLRDLAAAGCPLIEIHEPAATAIGTDDAERALFREAHLRLLDGIAGSHLSLALTGGNADAAGVETLLAAPYASLAVDLIAGPDNWRLVAAAPGDLGIICGVLSPSPDSNDGPEPLLWAAGYAASTGGRGPARVGLATASSFADLSWDVAVRKLERLGEAGRLVERRPRPVRSHSIRVPSAAAARLSDGSTCRRRAARTRGPIRLDSAAPAVPPSTPFPSRGTAAAGEARRAPTRHLRACFVTARAAGGTCP